ncbi:MAG: TRAP transporter small permease subunit [Sphaerochaetaceae bacterium]|jgi:TRAP-type C4-dicarboxylate transport system permease small subunit|nr:TRAP transporter small permease subunit [Sphaerochaetaceae bacterium]
MITLLKKIDKLVAKALYILIQGSIVILLVLLSAQVIARYFRIQALAPQDEIINLFFAWFVFIGIALLFREDGHLRVEFVDGFLSTRPRLEAVYHLFSIVLRGIFIAILLSSSFNLYVTSGPRSSPMLHLPQRYWYGSILVASILMSVHCVVKLIVQVDVLIKAMKHKELVV